MTGEHAQDLLDGLTCQECGAWFEDVLNGAQAPGHPRTCAQCKPTAANRPPRNKAMVRSVATQPKGKGKKR